MTTKFINCQTCGKPLEYWTIADFIECTGCKEIIQVEPCEAEEEPIEENIELIEVGV